MIDEIKKRLKAAFPDAEVSIQDMKKDGQHLAITVASDTFEGKTRLDQHKAVYRAIDTIIGYSVHACTLTTRTKGDNS